MDSLENRFPDVSFNELCPAGSCTRCDAARGAAFREASDKFGAALEEGHQIVAKVMAGQPIDKAKADAVSANMTTALVQMDALLKATGTRRNG